MHLHFFKNYFKSFEIKKLGNKIKVNKKITLFKYFNKFPTMEIIHLVCTLFNTYPHISWGVHYTPVT